MHSLLPRHEIAPPRPRGAPLTACLGRLYRPEEIAEAIAEFEPWVEVVGGADAAGADAASPASAMDVPDAASVSGAPRALLATVASAISSGEIVGWFQGRAEVGPRALGSRCILADPRRADAHRRVNRVKRRERFRPLAPSVLAEEAPTWFDPLGSAGGSDYMSLTANVRPEFAERIPAVVHVDGTARLQTVSADAAPLYYALIAAFAAVAGVPLVLNTSFNLAGEPIVESPTDALRTFLNADEDLSLLVLGDVLVRRRPFAATARPLRQSACISRTLADSSGEARRVEVLVDDTWIELGDALELEILERADGEASAAEIAAEIGAEIAAAEATEGGESDGAGAAPQQQGGLEAEVIARLRRLYRLRLISMD